jgi:DNA-binding CsgD family transcriptional regulator
VASIRQMSYLRLVPTRLSHRDQHAVLGLVSEAAAVRSAEPFGRPTIESLLRVIPARRAGYFEYGASSGSWVSNTFFVDEPASCDPSDWGTSDAVRTTVGSWPLRDGHRTVLGPPVKLSDFLTRSQLRRNPWYCEVMRPSGIEHELKVWLSAPAGTMRGFFLVRGRAEQDFDERDRGVLDVLRPHLTDIRERWERRRRLPLLTRRETEVLELVARGLTNGEIADRLVVSRTTVRTHLENVFAKLDVHTRTAAVARLQDAGVR